MFLPSAARKTSPQIGRFAISRTLGKGAEGTVYLATDTRLGRAVALKTMAVANGPGLGEAGVATLLDEARIVSTLSHPNIVTLYDAGEENGAPYLVFEYVEGQTLAGLIAERGKLEVDRAVEIAIALAQGVAYAHERNIVHRDLKPANVMITREGMARLMDFGIARRIAAPDTDGPTIVGTPSYMAPEYITERICLPASDVFSLGVVLYEMLTGAPPVVGSDPRETVRRIVEEDFLPPSRHTANVDERLDGLLMKALAKSPAQRFGSAADMAAALAAYLHPDAPEAAGATQGTLEYLLRRIRHKGDFPALSATISAVNRAASSDREPVGVLCNSILKDFALTNRLLDCQRFPSRPVRRLDQHRVACHLDTRLRRGAQCLDVARSLRTHARPCQRRRAQGPGCIDLLQRPAGARTPWPRRPARRRTGVHLRNVSPAGKAAGNVLSA